MGNAPGELAYGFHFQGMLELGLQAGLVLLGTPTPEGSQDEITEHAEQGKIIGRPHAGQSGDVETKISYLGMSILQGEPDGGMAAARLSEGGEFRGGRDDILPPASGMGHRVGK